MTRIFIPGLLLRDVYLLVTLTSNLCLLSVRLYFFLAEIHQTISFSMFQKKKLTRSCGTLLKSSIMKLEQLIFTWKGRQLVLARFASLVVNGKLSNRNFLIIKFQCRWVSSETRGLFKNFLNNILMTQELNKQPIIIRDVLASKMAVWKEHSFKSNEPDHFVKAKRKKKVVTQQVDSSII